MTRTTGLATPRRHSLHRGRLRWAAALLATGIVSPAWGGEAADPTAGPPGCCAIPQRASCCAVAERVDKPALASFAALPMVGWIFDTSPYPPRWYCGQWAASIGWLHIVSDVTIWLAYVAIPCALYWFIRKRRLASFRRLFLLFSAFILCCGTTHLMEAVIFWWPAYGLAGLLKLTTAVVSVWTVLALAPMIPRALAMRSPEVLEQEVMLRTAESELARREAALLVEASPAGVVVVDERGVVVRVNSVTEQLFGYGRDEMLGEKVEMLLPDRFRERHADQRASFLDAPAPRQMGLGRDVFARHADGHEFPVEIGLSLIESGGSRLVLAAIVDVSERKRLRRQLEESTARIAAANDSLRRSNQELEQFAFVASHDLQEPLRKIASFCQLLKDEKGGQLDEEAVEYVDIAINGAERLKSLVRDLLTFSRITTRGRPLCSTDADACFRAALSDLELRVTESEALVTSDVLPIVEAEPTQLRGVFLNLLGNALKYRGERAPRIHISSRHVDGEVEFSIRDNGIGIAPEHHERIFGIFQRLHNRREYEGTGIGLAQCKKIVERFGGRIWLESTPGEGTTFYFTTRPDSLREDPHAREQESLAAVG